MGGAGHDVGVFAGMTWGRCGGDSGARERWWRLSGVEATYPNEVEEMETLGWVSA